MIEGGCLLYQIPCQFYQPVDIDIDTVALIGNGRYEQ